MFSSVWINFTGEVNVLEMWRAQQPVNKSKVVDFARESPAVCVCDIAAVPLFPFCPNPITFFCQEEEVATAEQIPCALSRSNNKTRGILGISRSSNSMGLNSHPQISKNQNRCLLSGQTFNMNFSRKQLLIKDNGNL